jgi:hypothetical protein
MILLMTLAGGIMAAMTNQSAFRVKKTLNSSRALAIAEAGVADILAVMNTNYSAGVGVNYTKSFGNGSFTVITSQDAASGNVLITSTGKFNNENRTTKLELLGDKYANWNALASDCTIIAGGNATLETAAPVIMGRIHANGNIFNSKGNIIILGDLSANGIIQIKPQCGFTATPCHPKIDIPSYLPLDPWMEKAKNGGLYFNCSRKFAKVDLKPGNGVIYVNGDVELGNRSAIHGTLVASGSITINNRLTQTQFTANWPSLLAGVDINLNNRNHFTGAIFAGNNITSRNNKTIDGQLIALNNIYLENRAQLPALSTPPAWTPDGVDDPEIIVGGWLQ